MGGLPYHIRRRCFITDAVTINPEIVSDMSKIFFLYSVIVFLRGNDAIECSTELSAETRLRKTLFCNYDKMVRPVRFFENQTLVQFQLYPTKIYIEEYEEVIEFQGNILYVWTDAFLKWDPREYEGIDFVRVSSTEIWVPDITVDSWSQSTTSPSMTGAADCHLAHTGNVYCFIMTTLRAPCTPDITSYPFDIQNCTLTFSSSGFVGKFVNFTLFDPKNGIKMTLYKPNVFWELKEAKARQLVQLLSVDDESIFYPLIRCNFILRRHAAGHAAIVVLPAAVLAGLTLLIFWMDTMHEARIGIAAVVLLSDVIYCVYLGFILPSNGNKVPAIVTVYRDSLIIAVISIAVTVTVRHVRLKTQSPPLWVTQLIAKMESVYILELIFLGERTLKAEDAEEILENSTKKYSVWYQLATLIDRTFFCLLCFTNFVLVFFYIP